MWPARPIFHASVLGDILLALLARLRVSLLLLLRIIPCVPFVDSIIRIVPLYLVSFRFIVAVPQPNSRHTAHHSPSSQHPPFQIAMLLNITCNIIPAEEKISPVRDHIPERVEMRNRMKRVSRLWRLRISFSVQHSNQRQHFLAVWLAILVIKNPNFTTHYRGTFLALLAQANSPLAVAISTGSGGPLTCLHPPLDTVSKELCGLQN